MVDYIPRLKVKYSKEIRGVLKEKFAYKNEMMIPKLQKIVLNMGVGEAVGDSKKITSICEELAAITGQKPVVTRAKKSIANFGYHIQAAFYLRVLQSLGLDSYDFIFIAIEKTAPFCVGVYRASIEMLEEGNKKVDEAINQIICCKENDSYPDYTPNEIETISLPPWMTKKSEEQPSQEEIELY